MESENHGTKEQTKEAMQASLTAAIVHFISLKTAT